MRSNGYAVIGVFAALALAGCGAAAKQAAIAATGGDPDRGASDISRYGCGFCHTIPGISGAHGKVGPSLAGIGSRLYIAGILPNQPAAVASWIENPPSLDPKTVMPKLGVTPRDATDIAAYLYSLK